MTCDPACTVTLGNGAGDRAVSVSLPELAAGAALTVTYQVTGQRQPALPTGADRQPGQRSASNAPSANSDDLQTPGAGDATLVTLNMGALGGTTWRDDDNDGTRDVGEAALAGVGVTLLFAGPDQTWGTADDQTAYSAAGADGSYRFDLLAAGKYVVGFTLP